MPNVNPIKGAYGEYRGFFWSVIGYIMDDLHLKILIFIKSTSKMRLVSYSFF
jgi:hypothetical protein